MRFGNFFAVHLIWFAISLGFFLFWAYNNKKELLDKFVQKRLLPYVCDSVLFERQKIKCILLVVAVIFAILSLMRPQIGFSWQEVKRHGLDIVVAIDTSKSMLAADVKPNRLERSKLAVKDLVKKLKGDRIGLIAFSGTAYLQCPLTIDYNGFLLSLNDLDSSTIPMPGTSISSAINKALDSYSGGEQKDKILILITDGEDLQGDAIELAKHAKDLGLKIFTIGIGTAEGELIQYIDDDGNKLFLKDKSGNYVRSRLNEDMLHKIASITGGAYVKSSGAQFGLDLIYEQKLSTMVKGEIKAHMKKRYHERFQVPLFIALILLVLELFVSDRKRNA